MKYLWHPENVKIKICKIKNKKCKNKNIVNRCYVVSHT